jgi:acyl carrier protein
MLRCVSSFVVAAYKKVRLTLQDSRALPADFLQSRQLFSLTIGLKREVWVELEKQITKILMELLDIEKSEINPDAYLIRELGAESIDLLELAVAINAQCGVKVNDDDIFLKHLRLFMKQARDSQEEPSAFLAGKYPFLSPQRTAEIVADLQNGPVLKVKDLISYIEWQRGR